MGKVVGGLLRKVHFGSPDEHRCKLCAGKTKFDVAVSQNAIDQCVIVAHPHEGEVNVVAHQDSCHS